METKEDKQIGTNILIEGHKEVVLTGTQIKNIRHALGLDWKNKPYRNFYCCSKTDEGWNDLVNKGFAVKRDSVMLPKEECYFFVTKEGADFIGVKLPEN